jgi:hypothetical protein
VKVEDKAKREIIAAYCTSIQTPLYITSPSVQDPRQSQMNFVSVFWTRIRFSGGAYGGLSLFCGSGAAKFTVQFGHQRLFPLSIYCILTVFVLHLMIHMLVAKVACAGKVLKSKFRLPRAGLLGGVVIKIGGVPS